MLILPQTLAMVIGAFAPMFSKRVFEPVQLLIVGAILAPGKRTVTSALRVMGKSDDRPFQRYHRVLSRAPWPARHGGHLLRRLLLHTFMPSGPVVIGIDETIERRRGEQIAAKGISRDPVRSSHAHVVNASGLRWVSLMLLAPIPWTMRVWGWPFLTVLSPSERYYPQRGRSPQPLLDRARHAVRLVRRWLPEREVVVVGDQPMPRVSGSLRSVTPCVSSPACDSMRPSMSLPRHVNRDRTDGPARRGNGCHRLRRS